jgi:tetratricopeptide (TPR) repeat protein
MFGLFQVRGYWQDAVRANKVALQVAFRTQDRPGQAHAHRDLGVAYRWLGRHDQAAATLGQSLAAFRELGDRQGQANCLRSLGVVQERLGRYDHAIACGRRSLAIFRELGDRWGQAASLNSLGVAYERRGRYQDAIVCQQEALTIFQELGNHHVRPTRYGISASPAPGWPPRARTGSLAAGPGHLRGTADPRGRPAPRPDHHSPNTCAAIASRQLPAGVRWRWVIRGR